MNLCTGRIAPPIPKEWEDDPDLLGCCIGAAMGGPDHCTCWEPVYDLEQQPPRTAELDEAREKLCGDCAYRKDSPEMQDEHDRERLLDLPNGGNPFWCHQGIRRPREYRHPSGKVIAGLLDDYRPPQIDNRPYKADGSPADVCAGWAKRREVLA